VLDRPDVRSERLARAFADLCVAWVAMEIGLPPLGEALSADVIRRMDDLVVAHGLYAQACLDQSKPIESAWKIARSGVASSDLGLFLSAHHKASLQDRVGAAADLLNLLDRQPQHHQVRYDMARWLKQENKIDDAIDQLWQLVGYDSPYKIPAANDLAYLLAQHHPDQLDRAHDLARSSLDVSPGMMTLSDTVGWIEHLRGNHRL